MPMDLKTEAEPGCVRGIAGGIATVLAAVLLVGCGEQSKAPDKTPAASEPGVLKTSCGMEMVSIPGGEFTMGADDGSVDVKPAHRVKVDGFLMDRQEVPQEVYEKVTGKSNPSRVKNPRNPVEQVTWTAAVKFCNARSAAEGLTPCYDLTTWACDFSATGYRLPTEAEWEKAARGDGGEKFPWGSDPIDCAHANLAGCTEGTEPVGSHPSGASPYGALDMAGNVVEWVSDVYDPSYYGAPQSSDPGGPAATATLGSYVGRGGGWDSTAIWQRTGARDDYEGTYFKKTFGVRCAAPVR